MCTECVILLAEKTFSPPVRLSRIDPIVHDPPAYERRDLRIPIPSVQQQSVTVVRTLVDGQLSERHRVPLACYGSREWSAETFFDASALVLLDEGRATIVVA
jgi:hypothetical protein